MSNAVSNKPVAKVDEYYPIQVSIWRNTTESKSKPFYNFTIERVYKDKGGKYKSSHSFSEEDALLIPKVLDRVHDKMVALRAKDRGRE